MIIIVFVALLLFGGEKLPEIARGLGKGIRDFKDASEGIKREINDQINNYEVKKEEKKVDEAIAAAENQPAVIEEPKYDGYAPAANTISVSDNIFNADKHAETAETHTNGTAFTEDKHATEGNVGVHVEPLAENHVTVHHTETVEATTNEPIKNS